MCTGGKKLKKLTIPRQFCLDASAKGVQAPLCLYGLSRCHRLSSLRPRDSFPSALSALSTAAPGSLFKATPSKFQGFPPQQEPRVRPVFPSHWWSRCPAVPVPLQTGPRGFWTGTGRRAPDDKQRMTSPLHLGEDSDSSSEVDIRLEGDGLSWIC